MDIFKRLRVKWAAGGPDAAEDRSRWGPVPSECAVEGGQGTGRSQPSRTGEKRRSDAKCL